MNKIIICIPTYKRPTLLRSLLKSILDMNINKEYIHNLIVMVLDNDEGKSAEPVINSLISSYISSHIELKLMHFTGKGLANIRNELLKEAILFTPDFIVFIDDDEFVSKEWLNELVMTLIFSEADVATGPVISVFNAPTPTSISCWFQRSDYSNNTEIDFIRTGNLIIRLQSLLKYDVWFNKRFNYTGGEDSYFGQQLLTKGAKIHWAQFAIVYENVLPERAKLSWLFKRYYNGANIYTTILRIDRRIIALCYKIFISIFYLIQGLCTIFIFILPIKKRYFGVLRIAEALGSLSSIFSIRFNEYKRH